MGQHRLHVHVAGEYHFRWNIFAYWLDYVAAVSRVVLTLFAGVLLSSLPAEEEIGCWESGDCPRWARAVRGRTWADAFSACRTRKQSVFVTGNCRKRSFCICWSTIGAGAFARRLWNSMICMDAYPGAKCGDGWAASRGCTGATLGSSSCTESITPRWIVECIQSHFCCGRVMKS